MRTAKPKTSPHGIIGRNIRPSVTPGGFIASRRTKQRRVRAVVPKK